MLNLNNNNNNNKFYEVEFQKTHFICDSKELIKFLYEDLYRSFLPLANYLDYDIQDIICEVMEFIAFNECSINNYGIKNFNVFDPTFGNEILYTDDELFIFTVNPYSFKKED